MKVGTLEIELLANMARLQSDMDKAKRTVSDTVAKMNKVLGAIGVGVSLAGITSMVKSVVNVGDRLNDLRKITGLTVNELGGLDKQAKLNGTNLDAVARAVGVMSKNMYVGIDAFKLLGIATKDVDGNLRNANQVLLDVAGRFSRMQDGAQKSALANQIFGKSGRELIPMLNEGRGALESAAEAHLRYSGITQESAEASDIFNDNLTLLSGRATAIKTSFVRELLPTLNAISTAMLNSGQSTNQFSFAAQVVVPVLKGLAIAGFTVVDTFRGMGREIGARAAQLAALANMDFKGAKFIGTALSEENKKSRIEFDKFIDTVMNGDKSIKQLTETQKEYLKIEQQLPGAVDETARALKKKKVLTDAEQLSALRQQESTRRIIDLDREVRRVTDSVATSQDKYNAELAELNRLKPYLTVETYNRALQKAQDELRGTAAVTRTATNEVSQMWIQAGRNIQSSLGNLVFDFFNGGLNDMVRNAGNAVLRIMSEFAGLKIAQSIGLAGMFSGAGGVTVNAKPKGLGTLTALSAGTLGVDLLSMFKGGFGSMGLMSGIGGMLPGSAGAFAAGMGGGTVAGVSSTASLMGSSFAAVAGPAVALFAVDAIGRMLAGDKKLGGAEHIPVIGGFLAAMFGRGPMKFRQQVAIGEATSEGFDGRVTDVFRAKGGLFVGNKHREQAAANEAELLDLFNTTIKGYADASRGFATTLGLDVEIINGYHKTIRLESEKKKTLTEEAIRDMLTGIGNELADSLVPAISTLKKAGEDSMATLSRLNSEFLGLTQGAENLGASIGYAKDLIMGMSFESRTAFVEAAGGLEALAAKTQFFSQNFLTDAERLAPAQERLNAALVEMGLSTNLTRDEFKNLVQTNDELRLGLLKLAPEFVAVRNAEEDSFDTPTRLNNEFLTLTQAAENLGAPMGYAKDLISGMSFEARTAFVDAAGGMEALTDKSAFFAQNFLTDSEKLSTAQERLNKKLIDLGLSTSLTKDEYKDLVQHNEGLRLSLLDLQYEFVAVRNASEDLLNSDLIKKRDILTAAYNQESAALNGVITRFKSLGDTLRAAKDALSISELSPLNPIARLDEARAQFNRTRLSAAGGDESAIAKLPEISKSFLEASRAVNSSSAIFTSDFNFVSQVLGDMANVADNQSDTATKQLTALNSSVGILTSINSSVVSVDFAIADLTRAILAMPSAQAATVLGTTEAQVSQFTGGASVSDQTIRDYISSGASITDIYNKAKEFGISKSRIATVTGVTESDIDQLVKSAGLPSFDRGGLVKETGLAMVHKAERVINPQQNEELINEIKAMRKELESLRKDQEKQTVDLINVTSITNKQNADVISKSSEDIAKSAIWRDRSRVAIK